jgi:hypothetical protein
MKSIQIKISKKLSKDQSLELVDKDDKYIGRFYAPRDIEANSVIEVTTSVSGKGNKYLKEIPQTTEVEIIGDVTDVVEYDDTTVMDGLLL